MNSVTQKITNLYLPDILIILIINERTLGNQVYVKLGNP